MGYSPHCEPRANWTFSKVDVCEHPNLSTPNHDSARAIDCPNHQDGLSVSRTCYSWHFANGSAHRPGNCTL